LPPKKATILKVPAASGFIVTASTGLVRLEAIIKVSYMPPVMLNGYLPKNIQAF
jgi:hypothetical protein